jgi:LPXTG-motif cell wall-anchored protein
MAQDKQTNAFAFFGLAALILLLLFFRKRTVQESVTSRVIAEARVPVVPVETDVGPALLLQGKPTCPAGTELRDTGAAELGGTSTNFQSTRWRCVERLIGL